MKLLIIPAATIGLLCYPAMSQTKQDCQLLATMFGSVPLNMSGMQKSAAKMASAGEQLRPKISAEKIQKLNDWITSADAMAASIETFIEKSREMRNLFEECS